jgi:hypothetical protein
LFWIVNLESSQFSKIWPVFTNPTNPHESSHILSTIAQKESLNIQICKSWILSNPDLRTREFGFGSPNLKDLYCGFDSWPFFKRFVSWIWFARPKISTYSIHINLEGLEYKSRKLRSHIFRSNTFVEKTFNFQKIIKTWESVPICLKFSSFS